MLLKLIPPVSFDFLCVATRKLKTTQVACVLFLLEGIDPARSS